MFGRLTLLLLSWRTTCVSWHALSNLWQQSILHINVNVNFFFASPHMMLISRIFFSDFVSLSLHANLESFGLGVRRWWRRGRPCMKLCVQSQFKWLQIAISRLTGSSLCGFLGTGLPSVLCLCPLQRSIGTVACWDTRGEGNTSAVCVLVCLSEGDLVAIFVDLFS